MDHDHNPDPVDEIARRAGAALRQPPPSDALDRLRAARRRRQVTRPALAGVAILAVGGITFAVVRDDGNGAGAVSPVTVPTTAAPTTTEPPAPSSTVPSPFPGLPYLLTLPGLAQSGEIQQLDGQHSDESVSVWSIDGGLDSGFVVLRDFPDNGEHSVEGDIFTSPLDVPFGQAVLETDNVPDPPPSASRVLWWRGDGRAWLVDNYGIDKDRLVELALAIQPGSGVPHLLPVAGVELVGTYVTGDLAMSRQEYRLDGSTVILSASNSGLAAQVSGFPWVAVESTKVFDWDGYRLTMPQGQVAVIWHPVTDSDVWFRLDVSSAVADRTDEILASLVTVE